MKVFWFFFSKKNCLMLTWSDFTYPLIMGILNVTPDSFSDGGAHPDPIATGLAMARAGADIIDIGGESTRPGSTPLAPEEEIARVVPVITALAQAGLVVSLDTRHAATMRAGLAAGARIINDISALTFDPESAAVVAESGCLVVLMHMRGTPQTMRDFANYTDIATEVTAELAERIAAAEAAGIARARIAIDPGIGFAKRPPDSVALLQRLDTLQGLGLPILAGVSRKGFIGKLSGETNPAARAPGSIAAALWALNKGADILRVHDVPETIQAVRVWQGLKKELLF
jgi:dihydropteroate synthase